MNKPTNPFAVFKAAGSGDRDALHALAMEAWKRVCDGERAYVGTAIAYARLAASQGQPRELMALAGMLSSLARTEREEQGADTDNASRLLGEALAFFGRLDEMGETPVADLLSEYLPAAVEEASAQDVQYAALYKELMKC